MATKKKGKTRTPRRPQRKAKPDVDDSDLFGNTVVRLHSLRQYAAHRVRNGLSGGTLKAVQKAIQSGRIQTEPGGKINPALADDQWDENTNDARATDPEQFSGDGNAAGNRATQQLRAARLIRETFQARLVKMDFDEKSRTLINKDTVYKQQFAASRKLRDKLLTLGDRIAPIVKGKANITEIAEAANTEVRIALREFVEELNDGDDTTD